MRWLEEGPRLWEILAAAALYGALLFVTEWRWLPWLDLLFLFFPAWEDGRTGVISDGWPLLLLLTGLATAFQAGRLSEGLAAGVMMLVIYGFLFWISKGGVGSGDVLLAGAAALWLTPVSALASLWLSCIMALLYVGISYVAGKRKRGVRFAPFIALGGGLAYGLQELSLLPALWVSFG